AVADQLAIGQPEVDLGAGPEINFLPAARKGGRQGFGEPRVSNSPAIVGRGIVIITACDARRRHAVNHGKTIDVGPPAPALHRATAWAPTLIASPSDGWPFGVKANRYCLDAHIG